MTDVMLGGVPIRLHSGAPQCEYSPLGGVSTRRRSGGALVKMRNWRKTAITVRGTGWMGPGFAGLDFDQPLELRCNQPLSLYTAALTGTIPGSIRPDEDPWALAYVGGEWVRAELVMAGNAFTLTSVAGALEYHVRWLPMFSVLCEPPPEALDSASASFDWSITAEEI